jgi:predicted O-methyltransferase YrrM
MAGFEEAWGLAEQVEGWLTKAQGRALFSAAAATPPGTTAVEVGTHHGKSALVIAAGLPAGVELTCVDPYGDPRWGGGHEALGALRANLESTPSMSEVRLVRSRSGDAAAAWPGSAPLGFVYIDGAHDYASARDDIALWGKHLVDGGSMLIHDAFSAPGVTFALLREVATSTRYHYHESTGSLVRLRVARPSLVSRIRLLLRLTYFARNIAVKVALARQWHSLAHALGHRSHDCPY